MRLNDLRLLLPCALLMVAPGCGGEKQPAPSGPPPNAKVIDESKTGNVAGRVMIEGTLPANPPIQLSADPYCQAQNPNGAALENFVVNNGGPHSLTTRSGSIRLDRGSHMIVLRYEGGI